MSTPPTPPRAARRRAATGGVVLDEVYGGGGSSSASTSYRNDFVELADRGAAQDLSGWSVQYLTAAPSASSSWNVTPLNGTVAAGDTYLISEGTAGPAGAELPPSQAIGPTNLSATSGTVALVRSTTALGCKTAADCATDPDVVDLGGYTLAASTIGTVAKGGLAPVKATGVDQRYTYVYNGVSQVLDHILVTKAPAEHALRYQVVHVNAEYSDQVSDHDPQVVDFRP